MVSTSELGSGNPGSEEEKIPGSQVKFQNNISQDQKLQKHK